MKISIAKKILKSEEKFVAMPKSLAAWMNGVFPDLAATGPTWRRRLDDAKEQIDDYNKQLELDLQELLDQGVDLVPASEPEMPDGPDDDGDEDGPTN